MRILQINVVKDVGSTGKIMRDLHTEYSKIDWIESYIMYAKGNKPNSKYEIRVLWEPFRKLAAFKSKLTGNFFEGSIIGTHNVIKNIKKLKPDIIHIHVLNGYMVNFFKIIKFLKKNDYPLVITNHSEQYYTGSYDYAPDESTQFLTGKKEKIKNAKKMSDSWFFDKTYSNIRKMGNAFEQYDKISFVSVSDWVKSRASNSFVQKGFYHETILNGLDTKIFNSLRNNICEKNSYKKILYVTSSFKNPLKGVKYFFELAEILKDKPIMFIVVGLEKDFQLPENCINVGKTDDQNRLADYYYSSDLTLITSKRETFSMVVAESLCCGTPVIGFESGGPETITLREYSLFSKFPNIDTLVTNIKILLSKDFNKNDISKQAVKKYEKNNMTQQYLKLYQKTISGKNSVK